MVESDTNKGLSITIIVLTSIHVILSTVLCFMSYRKGLYKQGNAWLLSFGVCATILVLSAVASSGYKSFENLSEKITNQDKINIIIPIRNREAQLEKIIPRLKEILKFQKLDYRIYIIEQSSNNLFNKGKLVNIGFIESQKDNFSNYYIMNDVDTYPKTNDLINYTPYNGIKHLYGHYHCLGGIFKFDKDSFYKANGFSNEYYGWGWEDADFLKRLLINKVNVHRENFIERRSTNLIVDPPSQNTSNITDTKNFEYKNNKVKSYNEDIENIKKDGLSSCEYKITKKYFYQNDKKLIRILVDV